MNQPYDEVLGQDLRYLKQFTRPEPGNTTNRQYHNFFDRSSIHRMVLRSGWKTNECDYDLSTVPPSLLARADGDGVNFGTEATGSAVVQCPVLRAKRASARNMRRSAFGPKADDA